MGRRRRNQREIAVKTDGWIATFGDLTSLMLTFFVLMMSMSSIDKDSLKQISGPVQSGGIAIMPGGGTGTQAGNRLTRQERLLTFRQQAVKILSNSAWRYRVHVLFINENMLFRLPTTMLFAPGAASLKPADIATLRRLASLLQAMPGHIRVEGHTYREPPSPGSPYHDERELAVARAASVLHVLQQAGIDGKRLSLAGYGDVHPVAPGVTQMAIAKNRRVDIVLYQDAEKHAPATATLPRGPIGQSGK